VLDCNNIFIHLKVFPLNTGNLVCFLAGFFLAFEAVSEPVSVGVIPKRLKSLSPDGGYTLPV